MMFFKVCFCATLISAVVDLSDAPLAIRDIRDFISEDADVRQILEEALESKPLTVKPARIAGKINNMNLDNVDLLDEIGRTLLLVGHVNSFHPLWIQGLTSMKEKTRAGTNDDEITSLKQLCLHLTMTKDCTLLEKRFYEKMKFPPPTEEMLKFSKTFVPIMFKVLIQTERQSDRIIFRNFINQLVVYDTNLFYLTELPEMLTLRSVKDILQTFDSSTVSKGRSRIKNSNLTYAQSDLLTYLLQNLMDLENEELVHLLNELTDQRREEILFNDTTVEQINDMNDEDFVTFVEMNVVPYMHSMNVKKIMQGNNDPASGDVIDKLLVCEQRIEKIGIETGEPLRSMSRNLVILRNEDPPFIFESWGSFLGTGLSEHYLGSQNFIDGLGERKKVDYPLGNQLGRGAFGNVYKISKDGQEYAVKIVSTEKGSQIIGIVNEIKILQRNHQDRYLLSCYDVFRFVPDSDTDLIEVAVEMDLLNGKDLLDYVNERGMLLTEDEVSLLAYHVLQALDYLHSRGIVHLDVKPENIVYEQSRNRYVLIDYGFGATVGERINSRGTPLYIAPEMLQTMPDNRIVVQTSNDFFSLGTLLIYLMTGNHPNPSALGDTESQMVAVENGNVKAPTSGCSDECLDFLRLMFSMNPNDRFDAKEFLKHSFVSKHAPQKIQIKENNAKNVNDRDAIKGVNSLDEAIAGVLNKENVPVFGDETKQEETEEENDQRSALHESMDEPNAGEQSEGDPIDQIKASAEHIARSIKQKKVKLDLDEFRTNLELLSESLKNRIWEFECNFKTLLKYCELCYAMMTIVDRMDATFDNKNAFRDIRQANTMIMNFVDTCPGRQAA